MTHHPWLMLALVFGLGLLIGFGICALIVEFAIGPKSDWPP